MRIRAIGTTLLGLSVGVAGLTGLSHAESVKTQTTKAVKLANCPAPKPECATLKSPASFIATFKTTKGSFDVEVKREWAPLGADRFYSLVKIGFFKDLGFFRNVEGFVVQFGIHGAPQISSLWQNADFKDDHVKLSNTKGTLTFATRGPDTRTTQFFFNFSDKNTFLDAQKFSPFGKVVGDGMQVVEKLYNKYGQSPQQPLIQSQGNAYLKKSFPKLDYIKEVTIKSEKKS